MITLQRDDNVELALYQADALPMVGDELECDSFDSISRDAHHIERIDRSGNLERVRNNASTVTPDTHVVHYVVQRRATDDGLVDSVLSLELGTTITVRSPAPVGE